MSKLTGTKREIFAELMEGVGAMGKHREGKVTLRTHSLPAVEVKIAGSGVLCSCAGEVQRLARRMGQYVAC